ncbi:MAG: MarR family transcriptional regulator [Candidatus Nanopelagicales bacterium]|jgi:predicted NBD/HSP70 family sugar kinase|nr:MarR family transcriptional regulator [Candidatus Nanopelagicales bacterium]MCU0297828.1 MarR family transcriptional regulator [Candidatus Nanopelagicales bacterium]
MELQGHPLLRGDMPADPHDARRSNRDRLLRSIITRGPATRAELSRRTGLSRPTISVIANELLTTGLLMEGERVHSGGAPGTRLHLAKDTGVTIVVDLRDLSRLRMATVPASGEIATTTTVSVASGTQVLSEILAFSQRVEPAALLGVSLAVDEWVSAEGQWQGSPDRELGPELVEQLRKKLRLPVFTLTASKAIAVADLRDSPAGLTAQASLVLGNRLDMAITVGGRTWPGVRRPSGDIAHLVVGGDGPTCPICGRSCLQEQVRMLLTDSSADACDQAATALAAAVSPLVAGIELEEIVLAGFPDDVADTVATGLHGQLADRLMPHLVPTVRISLRGENGLLEGAAAMMLYRRLG